MLKLANVKQLLGTK